METNIFDFTSAIILKIFGKKFLQQRKLQTAYIRLLILTLCLFIEIVSLAVSFKGTLFADDMCKTLFSFIIISLILILITVCYFGLEVFESKTDDLELAKAIAIWTKSMGFVSGFFMFWYSIYLFDQYDADGILLAFTTLDFVLDLIEMIFLILQVFDKLPDEFFEQKVGPLNSIE